MVFLERAVQHGRQRLAVVAQRQVGDEAQAPLVDADQRRAVARQLAANAQHGAVAAHHHGQVALGADAGDVERGVVAQTGGFGRALGQHHVAALFRQKTRHVGNDVAG